MVWEIMECNPYLVVGLACWKDPETYAGGSVVAGTTSRAGQVQVDEPDEKEYSGTPRWRLGTRPTTSPRKKFMLRKLQRRLGWD